MSSPGAHLPRRRANAGHPFVPTQRIRPPDDLGMRPDRDAPATWMMLCPPGATVVDARDGAGLLGSLPAGKRVVIVDGRWGSRRRLRALAGRTQLTVERELILMPNRHAPAAVIDDDEAAVRQYWATLVPPQAARWGGPPSLAAGLARRLPWSWTGRVVRGRLLIGTRR